MMAGMSEPDSILCPISCHRCGAELRLGSGTAYLIRVEAMADPTPPSLDPRELGGDLNRAFREVLEELEHVSAQEAMDQVYRRLSFYLCATCYRRWIENPTG